MLTKLTISNFAIIEFTEISFASGFNVITGETGAGKSILLGALSLILGQRAQSNRSATDKKTVIEGFFQLQNTQKPFFKRNDIDFEEETIIRRELLPSGKSRAFINDTPVSLSVLKECTDSLLDLHQQHDSLSVLSASFQRNVVDEYAAITSIVKSHEKKYTHWVGLKKKLDLLIANQTEAEQKKEYLQFQYDELEQAEIKSGELEIIEQELKRSQNQEEISTQLNTINESLVDGESAAIQQLKEALASLSKLKTLDNQFEDFAKRIDSILIELEDIANSLQVIEEPTEKNQSEIEELLSRTNLINRLLSKHKKSTDEELLAFFAEVKTELNSIGFISEEIDELSKQIKEIEQELIESATVISDKRNKAKSKFNKEVIQLLAQVGMPKANFNLAITKSELSAYGFDDIQFLFSSNQGIEPRPIKQIASGGELSRVMLALKAISGNQESVPTLVFDEIDTGISGEVAKKVGLVLQELSTAHQLIVITHSPQVAAKGDQHFKVYKEDVKGKTKSRVISLSENERVNELAEMLSGTNPSENSLRAAKELISG